MVRRMAAENLDLVADGAGTRLRLKVHPGAGRDAVGDCHAGALRVSVTAAPERGKANRAVLGLLGRVLGLPKSSVVLVAGDRSRDKVVRVPLSPDEVLRRLAVRKPR